MPTMQDDFNILVFKILTYLYACLKGKAFYDPAVVEKTVFQGVNEPYRAYILRHMANSGLIEGYRYMHAWENVYVSLTDLSECQITPDGITFLKENSTMKKVLSVLQESGDVIVSLFRLII